MVEQLYLHFYIMEQYDQYPCTDPASRALTFEFTSTGPRGEIRKVVKFNSTGHKNIYNLVLGNITPQGFVDDHTTHDNKDRNKILATVAQAVYTFTHRYPTRYVFFAGNTIAKTRLYRMAITINYSELSKAFNIWGLHPQCGLELFRRSIVYDAFLIKKK